MAKVQRNRFLSGPRRYYDAQGREWHLRGGLTRAECEKFLKAGSPLLLHDPTYAASVLEGEPARQWWKQNAEAVGAEGGWTPLRWERDAKVMVGVEAPHR